MSIFVRVCIWVLGFYKVEALEQLMGFLKVWLSGVWLSYCAIVFACVDAIVMDEKLFNDFFLLEVNFICIIIHHCHIYFTFLLHLINLMLNMNSIWQPNIHSIPILVGVCINHRVFCINTPWPHVNERGGTTGSHRWIGWVWGLTGWGEDFRKLANCFRGTCIEYISN